MRDASVKAMKWINVHSDELDSIRFDFGVQYERALKLFTMLKIQ